MRLLWLYFRFYPVLLFVLTINKPWLPYLWVLWSMWEVRPCVYVRIFIFCHLVCFYFSFSSLVYMQIKVIWCYISSKKGWSRVYDGLCFVEGQERKWKWIKRPTLDLKEGKKWSNNNLNWAKGKNVLEKTCGQFPVNGFINNIFGV